jgi:AcrR family transcriptional regulator
MEAFRTLVFSMAMGEKVGSGAFRPWKCYPCLPMEHSALDTRTALLKAALACFAEHGYDGTSIRIIADRAKRPSSLLAHHFGNKEGLYQEVFKFIFETVFHKHSSPPDSPGGHVPKDKAEATRLLREQIHRIYLDCTRDPDPMRELCSQLWLQEIHSPRPSLVPILSRYMAPTAETVKNCIQTLRPDLDPNQVTFLGISIVGQVTGHGLMLGLNRVIWGKTEPPGSPFQAAEWLVDLCLHGLSGAGAQNLDPSAD